MLEIKATPISFVSSSANRITWFSSPSGDFELKERINWLPWKMMAGPLHLLMVNGFGRFVLSQKSSVLFGNVSIKAFRSAVFFLQGEWI